MTAQHMQISCFLTDLMTCCCQDLQALLNMLKATKCSDHLRLQVYAIGNPFGLDHTLTQVCVPMLPRCILSPPCSMPLYSVVLL